MLGSEVPKWKTRLMAVRYAIDRHAATTDNKIMRSTCLAWSGRVVRLQASVALYKQQVQVYTLMLWNMYAF